MPATKNTLLQKIAYPVMAGLLLLILTRGYDDREVFIDFVKTQKTINREAFQRDSILKSDQQKCSEEISTKFNTVYNYVDKRDNGQIDLLQKLYVLNFKVYKKLNIIPDFIILPSQQNTTYKYNDSLSVNDDMFPRGFFKNNGELINVDCNSKIKNN